MPWSKQNPSSPDIGGPERPASRARPSLLPIVAGGIISPLVLVCLSFFQKTIIGADPWVPRGYIIPATFGFCAGLFIGLLFYRTRRLHQERLLAHEKAARELRISEERFRLLAENARDTIFFYDLAKGRYEYLSPSVQELTGFSAEELYATPELFASLVHEDDRPLMDTMRSGISVGELPPVLEYRLLHRRGHTVWVNQRHNLRRDENGQPMALEGLCTDVSAFRQAQLERLNLEQQLQQTQKMEAIGRLAGGIAHDFNNLLTVINGYVDLLLNTHPWNDQPCFELQEIKRAGRKAADLTSQLLTFSRKQVAKPRVIEPERAVKDSIRMISRMVGERIKLKTEVKDELGQVYLDPTQLDQILVNLVLNARDAIPEQGDIIVSLEVGDLTGQFCQKCLDPLQGRHLILTVSDNGQGIEPEILDNIFDPFFTTKEVGQGTGLGLSTVFGIVHQLEGHIQVSSTPGQGTLLRVLLPLVELPPEGTVGQEIPDHRPTPRGEVVLVVEDEALVRSLAASLLQQNGFTVHVAENGKEGLKVWTDLEGQVDLVLTDVVMPEMDGITMARKLQDRTPGLPVLYMSGYMDENLLEHDFDREGMTLLNKPFEAHELVEVVNRLLCPEP